MNILNPLFPTTKHMKNFIFRSSFFLQFYHFSMGCNFANDVKIDVNPFAYFYQSHHFGFWCQAKIADT